ncbi:MAG: Fe/S biogenesis protein NfuA [Euryarchaeota archaeon]|nr:Fe/S biogenesis protein NfuA [Euryarchaeota archaeon]
MIQITDKAKEMLLQFQQKADDDIKRVLRVEIIGRGDKGFRYDLNLVDIEEKDESDNVCEVDDMTVLIAERSMQYMEGATLDFVETLMGGGFQFDNPNPMWVDDISVAVAEVIQTDVSPMVASHGGTVELLGVDGDKAVIAFGGGCQGCGMADVTLKQGIEVAIKNKVPSISSIVDATDHAAGTNPFY